MENKIKIFFEDDEDNFEKSFEKHSQEMRARMDSAFGSSLGSGSQKTQALPVLTMTVFLIDVQSRWSGFSEIGLRCLSVDKLSFVYPF